MTASTDFDRLVTSWLERAGPSDVRAEVVDDALATARDRDQRRGLRAWLLGPPAWPTRRRGVGFAALPPTVRVAILLGLLVAGLATAAYVGGRLTTVVPPTPPRLQGEVPSAATLGATGTISFGDGVCLNVIDAATGPLTPICEGHSYAVPGGGTTGGPWNWAPGGRYGIDVGANGLDLFDVATGKAGPLAGSASETSSAQTSFVTWSPLGDRIVWVGQSTVPGRWDVFLGTLDDPRRAVLPSAGDGSVWMNFAWSTDENRAVFRTGEKQVRLFTGDGTSLAGAIDFDSAFAAISSDGSRLAFLAPRGGGSEPTAVDVAITDGFKPLANITNFADGIDAVVAAWSLDDSILAVAAGTRTEASSPKGYELWLLGPDAATRRVPLPVPANSIPRSLTWSGDRQYVIVRSQEPAESYKRWATIVSVADGTAVVSGATNAVFSPDGRFALYDVAETGDRPRLMMVDLATGRSGLVAARGLSSASSLTWLE